MHFEKTCLPVTKMRCCVERTRIVRLILHVCLGRQELEIPKVWLARHGMKDKCTYGKIAVIVQSGSRMKQVANSS
jgi:hypothetical protein